MNCEKYFVNLPQAGDLYLEKVFVKFEDENILFICHDEQGMKYLGVCYEVRYALKWVLCKVTCEKILQMLCGVISVRDCFERTEESLLLITYTEEDGEQSTRKNLGDVESHILPDADFCLKYDMNQDAYYMNICDEMFKQRKTIASTMTINADQCNLDRDFGKEMIPYVQGNKHVIRSKITHPLASKNITKDEMGFCA